MQPSDTFFTFLANEEGLVLHPYKDVAGVPTIGYGSTFYENGAKVTMSDPSISVERARELAQTTLKGFVSNLNELKLNINQNQFDALLDFEYNEGDGALASSTLVKRIRANDTPDNIRAAFMMWDKVKINGVLKTNDWQVKRRTAEADLYFKPVA